MAYETKKEPRAQLSAGEKTKIVNELRDRIEVAEQHERENIEEALIDQRFRANDQWPDVVRREREAEGRPMLTINQCNQFIAQVVNPIRQADIAIKFSPVDDRGDHHLTKVYNGLARQIQYQSSARAVYAHAVDCQAGCGIGWFRICADYRDDESFDQEIYIERVNNPLSVYWDPAARDPVRSDAMWMAVTEMWPKSTFEAKWPDAASEDVQTSISHGDTLFWFAGGESIRVAEYFRKVRIKKTLAKLRNGDVMDITKLGEGAAGQLDIIATRTAQSYRVESYMVSGVEVLEGPFNVPGCYIPLIPAMGGEVAMEKGTYRYGVIRFARDAQQLYNINRTATAEWIGQSPKAPYIGTDKMFRNHQGIWNSLNTKNRNYLAYTPDKDAPGMRPERINPPEMPAAIMQDTQIARDDMKAATGIYDASLGQRSNETSGIAIQQRKLEGGMANYHFTDNFQLSLEHAGRILADWIPKIYDNERVIRILGDDDSEQIAPINRVIYGVDGQPVMVNDLSAAKFDVRVKIGPSYSTRREEAAAAVIEFMKGVPPEMAAVMADLVAKNSDWEGSDEIAARLKAMVPPQIVKAGEDAGNPDAEQMPPQQPEPQGPPPEAIILQLKKLAAEVEKLMADASKSTAQADQIRAQTGETRARTHQMGVETMHLLAPMRPDQNPDGYQPQQ